MAPEILEAHANREPKERKVIEVDLNLMYAVCWMEIHIMEKPVGKLVLNLYKDCPRTAENFY